MTVVSLAAHRIRTGRSRHETCRCQRPVVVMHCHTDPPYDVCGDCGRRIEK